MTSGLEPCISKGGREIEISKAGTEERERYWKYIRRTNFFQSRSLYNQFFSELAGELYYLKRGISVNLVLLGKWRSDSDFHMLWMIKSDPTLQFFLITRTLSDYLREGSMIITRMLPREETETFEKAGFSHFQTILLLEGSRQTVAPHLKFPSPFNIRGFRKGDIEEVLKLDHLAFGDFWKLDNWNLRHISGFCRLNNLLVAQHEDVLVGYCIAGVTEQMGFIQRLAVRPGFQRRGLGKALISRQLRWMRDLGVRMFFVNTQENNHVSQRLYHNMGFSISVTPRYIYKYLHGEEYRCW